MKKLLPILACLSLMVGVWACEQPKSPDFKLNHELEVPLTVQKTYAFLGQDDALIDTTSQDFEDLFSPDGDGTVRITKEQDFDFGNLDDAIPEVNVPPTTVNSQINSIELKNFASSGNIGNVQTGDIIPVNRQEGETLPGNSANNIEISNFSPDFFESAIVENAGTLNIVVTNGLGFNADNNLTVTLLSGGSAIGNDDISPLNHTNRDTAKIDISAGTQLSDLEVEVGVGWSTQQMQIDSEDGQLVVNEVYGQDDSEPSRGLIFSQITATLPPQTVNNSGTSTVDQSSFKFEDDNDFVGLESGGLTIDIVNGIDLGVSNLSITFPDIRHKTTNDPLDLDLNDIPASSSGGNFSNSYSLGEYRIYAENGTIDYNISGTTEDTQDGSNSGSRTISASDELEATVDLNNLQISRAEGYVVPDWVMLNDDQNGDGRLDAFNNSEAEITTIDGIDDLSNRVSNLTFESPILKTIYNTNLGVNTTVYAVIAGTDANGNTEYLTGNSGSEYAVQDSEIPPQLEVNGQKAKASQVIKFPIQIAETPDPQQGEDGENEFNASNTNASQFFSNLPSDIRFVGTARINAQQQTGTIVNPVLFEPKLNLDLPLNFSADGATYQDTVDADLSDLPGEEDDANLTGATLTLQYTNALPLDLDLVVTMLDANGQQVTHKGDISIQGASVDDDGYVNQPAESELEIPFSEEELNNLNQTRNMQLDVTINTPDNQAVRLKAEDSVTLQIQMKADITSTVN